jgi:GNAT superfamily N-acetyltransferase
MHRIEPLGRSHERGGFDCGEASLNDWLARIAPQHQRKNYSRTHVLVADAKPSEILGYYALTPHEVDSEHFPASGGMPRRLPAVLLTRLAVDRSRQGQRLGEVLLYDAIEHTRRSMSEIGGVGLLAGALNERAMSFYHQYGFQSFRDNPLRVVLVLQPTGTLKF